MKKMPGSIFFLAWGCMGSFDEKNGEKAEYSGPRGEVIGLYGRKWIKGMMSGTEDNHYFSHDPHLADCDLASSGGHLLSVNRNYCLYAVNFSGFQSHLPLL